IVGEYWANDRQTRAAGSGERSSWRSNRAMLHVLKQASDILPGGGHTQHSEFSRCAAQQNQTANVRFGSKADIEVRSEDVRFTPKSGHWLSTSECPLCAKSGHSTAAVWAPLGRRPVQKEPPPSGVIGRTAAAAASNLFPPPPQSRRSYVP